MSSFGPRRKARIIKVSDDDGGENPAASSDDGDAVKLETPKSSLGSRTSRKPFRQSGLRSTFGTPDDGDGSREAPKGQGADEEEDDGPAVVRPNFGRSGSSGMKKRAPKTKLSFGGDAGDEESDDVVTKPAKKAPLGRRAMENSASKKKGIPSTGLPLRSFQDDADRPKYSKEYLEELQSSTPNTPRPDSTVGTDEMELDSSELDGALVVESSDIAVAKSETQVLTEAEIRERKERRARLAKEQNFLSLEDDEDEDHLGRKKKDDTRLKAEDEELAEGFDDFVEDGGLSLGKRAEKERKKRDRKQMAELITAAEGQSEDESSDSDAGRRMAYEAAQTRAGMDGLKKPRRDPAEELLKVPAKISPIPSLSECIQRLQVSLKAAESDLKGKEARLEQLRGEKVEIAAREAEVQSLLDETGRKYQQAMSQGRTDGAPGIPSERGLESIGVTPEQRDGDEGAEAG